MMRASFHFSWLKQLQHFIKEKQIEVDFLESHKEFDFSINQIKRLRNLLNSLLLQLFYLIVWLWLEKKWFDDDHKINLLSKLKSFK